MNSATRQQLAGFVESSNIPIMAKAPALMILRGLSDDQVKPLLIPFSIVMRALELEQAGNPDGAKTECATLGDLLYQVIHSYASAAHKPIQQ